jgi:hypothetical protein
MIFVVGNSRSGTTLLGRMLGNNSEVTLFPELHLFGSCVAHGRELDKISKEKSSEIFMWLLDVLENGFFAKRNPNVYRSKADSLTASFYAENVDAWDAYSYFIHHILKEKGRENTISCEDMPGNVFKLDQILKKFPSSRIVNIVIDPRDIILSQKKRYQRRRMGGHYISQLTSVRFWANYHPYFIANIWKNAVRNGIAFENHPNVLNIRFEDLILNTKETLIAICNHCHIKFEDRMLHVPQFGSSTIHDNPNKIGVANERVGTWIRGGLYNGEVEICESIAKKEMLHFKYELSNKKASIFVKLWFVLLLPLKGVISILLNWSSTKGIINFIKTRILN